jgi:23S rRNA (cytosine1962-C5)-methyltransferase
VKRADPGAKTGDAVTIHDPTGKLIGQALWDATSPIAARIYTRSASPPLDARAIVAAIASAFSRRDGFQRDTATTAYRLCHGEGDRVPGVVIDRYADVAVLRLDGDAIAVWLDVIARGVWPLLEAMGVRTFALRAARGESDERLKPLAGAPPPKSVTVREHGMAMVVDLAHGQKTGAFLDQRENRRRVRELSRGRRVLNLFSYAGGFSLAAALGGATRVTSVDIAQAAHATAQSSFHANDVDPVAHAFVTADAFAFLASAQQRGDRWDLVMSDPPSFAPNEKSRPRALTAYRRLHAACAAVLAPGGIFCASSCSSHISAEDFLTTLDDGATNRSDLSLVEMHGHPWDHPTVPSWPEGRYLKFAVLR